LVRVQPGELSCTSGAGFVECRGQGLGQDDRGPSSRSLLGYESGYQYQYCTNPAQDQYCSTSTRTTSTGSSSTSTSTTTRSTTSTSSSSSSTSTTTPKPGKGCGDKNHPHDRRYQCGVSVNDVTKYEGNSGYTLYGFTISLSAAPIDKVTLRYWVQSDSAVAGSDFVAAPGTVNVTLDPGVKSKTYTVKVIGDRKRELNERFFFNLAGLSSNASFVKYQGKGTILNDD
jgi:large repetitive protein